MDDRPFWIVGAGGHAKVVAFALRARGMSLGGVFDDDPLKAGRRILGVPVTAPIPDPDAWFKAGARGILAIGDNDARSRLASRLAGVEWASVVHPSAIVSEEVSLGEGVFVAPRVVIHPGTAIGAHAIVNTGAIVEHDCTIGAFTHVAPGVVLAGHVRVGARTLIGVGVIAKPGVTIGDDVICGAGAVIVSDIGSGVIATGVPARLRSRNSAIAAALADESAP